VAIIERGSIAADRFELPDSQFLSLHADKGPLDQKALGGPIVVSGFAQDKDSSQELVDMLRNVAQGLWRAGATLAFGGRQSVQQHNLVYNLQQVLEQLPPPLDQTTEERDVRLVVFEGGTDKSDESVEFKPPPPRPQLTKEETDSLGEQAEWATGALWAFSKRLMMTELVARDRLEELA
jgi:hypothetical protein